MAGAGVTDTEDTQNWARLHEKTKTYISGEKSPMASKVQAVHRYFVFTL